MTIDPQMLMAYADGELDDVSAKRVERAMADDPALAAQVAAHQSLRKQLAGHYAPVAEAPVPERLTALLETNVVPFARPVTHRPGWSLSAGTIAAMAATLVLGLVLGQTLDFSASPVGSRGGALVAKSGLKTALDTQLASSQPRDAATRIGLTFRNGEGALCRTFEGASLAGIACRQQDDWHLRQVTSDAAEQGDYRKAGSAATVEAAQAMMAGDPLDPAAERAALLRSWK